MTDLLKNIYKVMTDCIFCKIMKGEIPSKKAFEDEKILAFYDISPKAPVHVLVVPKTHIRSLIETADDQKELMGNLMIRIKKIAKKLGLDKNGYKVVINNGKGSGQIVFHLHLHLLGGWKVAEKGWKV